MPRSDATRDLDEAFERCLRIALRESEAGGVSAILWNRLMAIVERATAWTRGAPAFLPEGREDDEAVALEAVRPFARQIAAAVRLARETGETRQKPETAADFPLDLGEAALWLPEFWAAAADLYVRASIDPTSEVASRPKPEEGWREYVVSTASGPLVLQAGEAPDGAEPATFETLRRVEAERRDRIRDELGELFSVLRGTRKPGSPPRPALGLLEEFEAMRAREEATGDPRGAAKRAIARMAARAGVTPSAIRKRLAIARRGTKRI